MGDIRVTLDKELHKAVRHRAIEDEKTIEQLVAIALAAWVNNIPITSITQATTPEPYAARRGSKV
jgi:hypothetical protein